MNSLFLPHGAADGYKYGHPAQYPDGTQIVVSNLTPRSTRRGNSTHVVLVGTQYFVKRELIERWNTEFFQKPKGEVIAQFTRYINSYFGPDNKVGFHHMAALHDLGYLPIKIYALPEGTVYPLRVPCVVIFNTHHDFYWLTNYLETIFSTNIWGICTSATTAKIYKDLLTNYAMATVGDASFVIYQAHDFSFRGMFGAEAAVMSSFGHISVGFVGSDTFPVLKFAEDWYGANVDTELVACSVPATEHSVMCAGAAVAAHNVTQEPENQDEKLKKLVAGFAEESPKLAAMAMSVISGETKLADGRYSSEQTDNQPVVYNFFTVADGKIDSLGEERVREGGTYWYRSNPVHKENVQVTQAASQEALTLGELETVRRLINVVYPKGIVSVVLDTWDFWKVLDPNGGTLAQLKPDIMARDGKLVVRPDTGDPIKIVCGEAKPVICLNGDTLAEVIEQGYSYVWCRGNYYYLEAAAEANGHPFPVPRLLAEHEVTPKLKGAMQCLAETFGTTLSPKAYKLLDSHVGLIYGDSITIQRAAEILNQLWILGFASTNIVFGIGSYTYAYVTRDTDGYAVKATWVQVNDEPYEIFKDPATGDGTKKSATGLVAVYKDEKGEFYYKDHATWEELENCELKLIFENGKLVKETTLQEIRAEIAKY